mmetsp:Transcript_18400/g.52750  ORF Transcript_18400/g.52750 Transcript_18400/m.52750 type:complete len:1039 (+) Transcript_18400:807-3923(+)
MGFLKKMFRRGGGGSKKVKEPSHRNIGELPSSPANKKKAAKKITRTEKRMAKQAQKAARKAAKNGGSLYGQGSPGSPTNKHTRKPTSASSGAAGRYEYTGQPDDVLPHVGALAPSPGSVSAKSVGNSSVADRSMNPVMDDVVRRPSFNTSSLSGSTAKSIRPNMSINTALANGHPSSTRSRGSGPVDLDEENYGSTTDEEFDADEFVVSPLSSINGQPQQQLNHQQLQQFEMQQRANGYGNGVGAPPPSSQYANLYGSQQRQHQVTRLPNGQLVAYDSPDKRGNGGGMTSPAASPTYSSDFCLSTDNEDENYNQMRRDARGLLPGAPPGVNLPPALDSPDNDSMMYTDDEQGTLFANLKGQFSEDEAPMSPPTSPEDLLPPPPSGIKPPPPAAAAPVRPQGPRDPDGDFSHIDPLSMEEEAEVSRSSRWAQGPSPDKSKMSGSNYTTATGSSRSGIDGSSYGSVENRNPNPNGTSPRYTFADGDEAAMYRKGAGANAAAEGRPASPSPGYKVNGPGSGANSNRGAIIYPDSTDSEFESVPVPNGNLLPAMQQQQQDQRAQSQNVERQMNQHQNAAPAATTEMVPVQKQGSQFAADAFGDSFANFANFESNFDPFTSAKGKGAKVEQKRGSQMATNGTGGNGALKSSEAFGSSGPTFVIEGGPTVRHSSADPSPLDDLMALQKEREENRQMNSSRRSRKDPSKSSSSINSAPVITSAYLRQTHKLGSAAGDGSVASGRRKSSRHSESGGRSNASVGSSSAAMAAKDKLRQRRREKERARAAAAQDGSDDEGSDADRNESWLFDGVTGTLGPRGIAADLESLGGRSNRSKNSTGNKSHRSHRSHRSSKSRRRKNRSDASVGSRDSRYSHKSYRSTRSQMSHMSEQSRSVANDLLRLEMQLAMVGAQKSGGDGDRSVSSRRSKTSRGDSSRRSKSVSKRTKVTVVAPPGKLGIILANKTDSKGTVVSGVRTSSVLADKVSPGDRIIAIDGEDVSRMTVSEITTIMARKSEFERILTVLTTKAQTDDQPSAGTGGEVTSNYR